MASSKQTLGEHDPSQIPGGKGKRFGIVVSEYHADIVNALLKGAKDTLLSHDVAEKDIIIDHAPGAFELPFVAKRLYENNKVDGIICLGCVIKGETDHDVYINKTVASAIMGMGLRTNKPFIYGVLTPNNEEQARERAGGKYGNKGVECAIALLKLAHEGSTTKKKIGF